MSERIEICVNVEVVIVAIVIVGGVVVLSSGEKITSEARFQRIE